MIGQRLYQKLIKRMLDCIFASLLLVIFSLPMIVIAGTIWLVTHENPIFKQTRFGRHSQPFEVYKFRTMVGSAPLVSHQYFHNRDAYVTTVGKFLRRTSLDELPQCFNVLRGEMSFVGPRPLAASDMAVIEKRKVLGADRVLPGITGLAQVSGRNNVSDCQKAMYDGTYAKQVSFTHDASIVGATLIKVLQQSDIDKA